MTTQTRKWVAQTFYGQMLKQMRNSPFKVAEFEGGRGGEAYMQMFDQRLAEHMTKGTGSKLVNAIVKKIESRNRPARKPTSIQQRSGHVSTDITA